MCGDHPDGARCVLLTTAEKVARAFDPHQPDTSPLQGPPHGAGGAGAVRLFAGDAPPLDAFNAHTGECGCDAPFLWVRLVRRYRTSDFPAPAVGAGCGADPAVTVEAGVARCAALGAEPAWQEWEEEAAAALDDSWRLETAMCWAAAALARCGMDAAQDETVPHGPDGGAAGWVATMHVRL